VIFHDNGLEQSDTILSLYCWSRLIDARRPASGLSSIVHFHNMYSLRLNLAECWPACKYNVALRQTDRIHVLQFVCPSLVLLDAAEGGMRMQYGFTTNRRMQYISYNLSVRPWCCWMLASGRHADAVAVRYVCGGASPISKPQRQRGDDDDYEYHTIEQRMTEYQQYSLP
jgi:hypothetical protein